MTLFASGFVCGAVVGIIGFLVVAYFVFAEPKAGRKNYYG
jgi:hypothetical protein